MPSNEVLALEANFNAWKTNRFPNPKKGENPFEYYCVEQFIRPYDLGDSQIKTGLIGGGLDGGVDAFYLLANGELVDSETELSPKDPPAFKLVLMQIKSDEGFSPLAVDKFYWFTDDLLDLSKKKADYHSTYNSDLIALIRLFKDKYGFVVGETPPLSIEFIYVIKKDVQPNADCQTSASKARISHFFPHATSDLRFVNASALWKQVQTRPPKKKTLKWAAQPMSTQEGEIGLVMLPDYFDFIREADGKIAERFFDSNVRGYWPTSAINKQITSTLESSESPEFWLLNNGITVLTEKIESSNGFLEIDIHDPQIVNGLQTSRSIYNYFSVIELLQAMISIVLHRPDDARARPRDYIKKNDLYKDVFGENKYSLTLYLKAIEIGRRVADYLDEQDLEPIQRRNIYFYLCTYCAAASIQSAFPIIKQIEKIDVSDLTEKFMADCYSRVRKQYEKMALKSAVDGEKDYDAMAKGPTLLKALQTELKQRFNKKSSAKDK